MNTTFALLTILATAGADNCPKPNTSVKYDQVYCLHQDTAIVKTHDRYGVVNAQGDIVIATDYADVVRIDNGHFVATKDGKMGILDQTGKTLVPFIYDEIPTQIDDQTHFVTMKKHGKYGMTNISTGQVVLPYEYDSVFPHIVQNIIYLEQKQNGQTKIGFADINTGKILLKPTYDGYTWVYSKPLVIVQSNGQYGVINHEMQTIVPIQFDKIYWLKDRFYAYQGETVVYFDEQGNAIQ